MNKIWKIIRPWWHIGSAVVIMTYLATMKWSIIEGYAARLISLEAAQATTIQQVNRQEVDIEVIKQEVHDIHEVISPGKRYGNAR